MAAHADPNQISPKVVASAVTGLAITLLGVVIAAVGDFSGAITTEQLPGLGLWTVPVVTLIQTLGQALVGWWKTDPLRSQPMIDPNLAARATITDTGPTGYPQQ